MRLPRGVIPISDIEFWDVPQKYMTAPPVTAASQRVLDVCRGREVLLVAGYLEVSKGLCFLQDLLESGVAGLERYCVVCAGVLGPDSSKFQRLLARADLVEARHLSQEELFSLYGVADVLWCCYPPERDMSSGIFGRALQFSKPTIVRQGSMIHRLQTERGSGIAVDFDETSASAQCIADASFHPRPRAVAAHGDDADSLKRAVEAHRHC